MGALVSVEPARGVSTRAGRALLNLFTGDSLIGSTRFIAASILVAALASGLSAQSASNAGINSIQADALREWLTYIASDELQGRGTYTEGLGLAAGYIADHLQSWGVKPA
ncbi:MAG: hypothetical protein LC804_12810, partial [Acidobacteria bacterium]|nr:hypothetical protein [Acidobacteriota bacterium]